MNLNEFYASTIERDEQGRIKFWRTGKGSKKHASWYCANKFRRIRTGDPQRLSAQVAKDWAPCTVCCPADEVAPVVAEQPAKCRNSGVVNPKRLYSKCSDCGKEGAVNRTTGTIRAHLPLQA